MEPIQARCQSEPVEDYIMKTLRQAQCDKLQRIGYKNNYTQLILYTVIFNQHYVPL